jgi:hypothetical protein
VPGHPMVRNAFVLIGAALLGSVLVGVGRLLLARERELAAPEALDGRTAAREHAIALAAIREVEARQLTGEQRRRWFSSEDFDLIVWFDGQGGIAQFELCYDRADVERALTWSPTHGYRHWRVDTGDASGYMYGMTPVLEPDDSGFPKDRVSATFAEASEGLDPAIRSFVIERLREATAPISESRAS